jgi:hypothetical protein
MPIVDPQAPERLEPVKDKRIELDRLYGGLESGRWLIVSGERVDLPGVVDQELVMLLGVEQSLDPSLPGDTLHTVLMLANDLAYIYQRDKMIIYGNVVKSTHGETRNEVLGGGSGSQPLQKFTLRQPLTVSAPNPSDREHPPGSVNEVSGTKQIT